MGDYSEKLKVVLQEGDAALADLPEAAPVFGTRAWLAATERALPFPLRILKVYKGESFAAWLPILKPLLWAFVKASRCCLRPLIGPSRT